MGRPKLGKTVRRSVQVGIRLSLPEMTAVRRAAREKKVVLSEWVRIALLREILAQGGIVSPGIVR